MPGVIAIIKGLPRLEDRPPVEEWIKLKCLVCPKTAEFKGNVHGRRFFYIHEDDGTHTLKIRSAA